MRGVVRSRSYARARVVIGLVASMLGLAIVGRTFAAVGFTGTAIPAYVLGLAMIALGVVRLRDYRAMMRIAAGAEPTSKRASR